MDAIREVVPIAHLTRPPRMPATLAGFLLLDGRQVPVLRLALLLGLPEDAVGLYTPLIVLHGANRSMAGLALLVDRVRSVVSSGSVTRLEETHSFNGCVRSLLQVDGEQVPVLSPVRLLLEDERQRVADCQRITQERRAAFETPADDPDTASGAAE